MSETYFARGGKGDLYKLPPRKTPPTNDWGDLDGLEVDLSHPVWGSITMDLSFVVGADASRRFTGDPGSVLDPAAWAALSGNAPTEMIPVRHRLREVTAFHLHRRSSLAELTCSYEVPDPMEVWALYEEPSLPAVPLPTLAPQRVTLSGVDLGEMGIGVLSYYDSALRPRSPKEGRYLADSIHRQGRILRPDKTPCLRAGVVEVACVIPHGGDERRVQGSLAMLSALITKPGEQLLNGRKCYYSEMTDCRLTRSRFYFTLRLQMI